MKLTVVNFGNNDFSLQQKWNSFSAKFLGKADKVISYSPNDIRDYLEEYPTFKKYKKGFGNYFWKPYVIQKALDNVEYDEFLFYSDSGALILKNLKVLANYLNKIEKDILVFQLPLIESQWTKRDTFTLLNADDAEIFKTPQILSGFILIKKTQLSNEFIEKFRTLCLDDRIVSDLENTLHQENYPEFIAHRHDQSVLSILAKKSSIVEIVGDLSDYGFFPRQYLRGNDRLFDDFSKNLDNYKFKNFVISNRKGHPLNYLFKFLVKRFLFAFNLYKRW